MSTSTIKDKIEKIVNELLGHDDGVEFGDDYHDECKKEATEAIDALLQLFYEAKVQGFMTAKGYRFEKNQWWIDRPNNGFGVMTQAMAEEWHDRTTKALLNKQRGTEK